MLADPCVARINQSSYLIASNKPYVENSTWEKASFKNLTTVFMYDFTLDHWIDISIGFPCPNVITDKIMCSKYHDSNVVIITIPTNGILCTGILDTKTHTWYSVSQEDESLNNVNGSVIFNPINDNKKLILLNGKNRYKMAQSKLRFKWEFEGEMKVAVNLRNFIGPSKFEFVHTFAH